MRAGAMRSLLLYVSALFAYCRDVDAARVLGIFPHTGRSHQMVYEPLLQRLAERGHQVTVVSFFPLQNPPANYTDVSLQGLTPIGIETVDLSFYESPGALLKMLGVEKVLQVITSMYPLDQLALDVCSKLVDFPPLTETLSKQYDVVLVEYFNSDCVLGLLHVHGVEAPKVALSSTGLVPWTPDRLGLTDNPSYVPLVSALGHGAKMTFLQRLENTILQVYYKYWYRVTIQQKEQELIEKSFKRKIPDLEVLGRNVSLMLTNTYYSLTGARPLLPRVVEAGGMHIGRTRKPIPNYMERFINESEHGVVLFSFGSLIRTATIPAYKEEMIVRALSRLHQRVIWKYEDSGEEGTLIGNILKVRWIPQYELLLHPKVHAFIAHGGLLGMTEAISAGKPMVVIPFFGDQPKNAAEAEAAGMAKALSYAELTEKSLYEAVNKVISAETRLNARRVSKIWKDRPAEPLETALFWTEHVIRWGHNLPEIAPVHLTFVEYTLLDVCAAILLAIVILILVLKCILSFVFRLIGFGPKKQKMH